MTSSAGAPKAGVRVLVVEDYPLMLAATCARLRREADIEVVGEASSAEQALSCMQERLPDIVLLDLRLGGSNQSGADLAAEIGRRFPKVRVVVYSAFLNDQQAEMLSSPNVWGYVLKTDPPRAVVDAIRTVARGGRCGIESRVS